jgi:hypothetical protein
MGLMIRGGLLTQFSLSEGIGDTPEWAALDGLEPPVVPSGISAE